MNVKTHFSERRLLVQLQCALFYRKINSRKTSPSSLSIWVEIFAIRHFFYHNNRSTINVLVQIRHTHLSVWDDYENRYFSRFLDPRQWFTIIFIDLKLSYQSSIWGWSWGNECRATSIARSQNQNAFEWFSITKVRKPML